MVSCTAGLDGLGLELKAGIDKELCIMGHGHFFTAHCIHCKRPYSIERYWLLLPFWHSRIQECVKNKVIPVCENCYRYVKVWMKLYPLKLLAWYCLLLWRPEWWLLSAAATRYEQSWFHYDYGNFLASQAHGVFHFTIFAVIFRLIPLMTSVKTPRLLMNKERVGLMFK